ncbi:MAG: hypothetical protein WAP74_02775 [Patescibacteria group bacterium]
MADIEFGGLDQAVTERERREQDEMELQRLQYQQEHDLAIARRRFSREIDLSEAKAPTPETSEIPVTPPAPEAPARPEPAKKTAEKLRQTFERASAKLLPRTGQRRVEQVNALLALAKRLGIRLGLADISERIAFLRGKGEMPARTKERLTKAQEAKQAEREEEAHAEEPEPLTTEEARDESFGRLDSMRAYVENLAERKPENLQRADRLYDLLLKTRNTKFDKWKEIAGVGLSLATLATLPVGGSASSLVKVGRMAFGSLNYSTIGFRMGSELGLRDEINWRQERYEQMMKMSPDDEHYLDSLRAVINDQVALYRAGVRFDRYESGQKGLAMFGKAGEVFQKLKQGKIFESGKTLWNAVIEDRKELLKLGGKMAFYSTPLIAAALAPGLALPLYAGTTGANMVERIMRYRQSSAKEQFEKNRKEPDPLLKRILDLADRYDQGFTAKTATLEGIGPEELREAMLNAQSLLSERNDERYLELQRYRGAQGLKAGAILGLISASFYGIMSLRGPAEAARPGGAAGAGAAAGAAGGATEHAHGAGKSTTHLEPSKSGGAAAPLQERSGTPPDAPSAGDATPPPDAESQDGGTGEKAADAAIPGQSETKAPSTETPGGKATIDIQEKPWPTDKVEQARRITQILGTRLREAVPEDFKGLEDLKSNESLTRSITWEHNGEKFLVGGITDKNEFFIDGQRFKIFDDHYIEVPVDLDPNGKIDGNDLINGKVATMKIDLNTGRSVDGKFAAWDKDVFFRREGATGSHEDIRLVASDRARLDQYGVSIGRDRSGQFHITHESLAGQPGLNVESFKAYLGTEAVPLNKINQPLIDYRWELDHFVYHKDSANGWLDLAHQRSVLDYSNFEGNEYQGKELEQRLAAELEKSAGSSADTRAALERGDKTVIEQAYDRVKTTVQTNLPEALKTSHRSDFLGWLKEGAGKLSSEAQRSTREALERVASQKVAFRIDKNFDSTYWLKIEGGQKPIQLDPIPGFKAFLERFKIGG